MNIIERTYCLYTKTTFNFLLDFSDGLHNNGKYILSKWYLFYVFCLLETYFLENINGILIFRNCWIFNVYIKKCLNCCFWLTWSLQNMAGHCSLISVFNRWLVPGKLIYILVPVPCFLAVKHKHKWRGESFSAWENKTQWLTLAVQQDVKIEEIKINQK